MTDVFDRLIEPLISREGGYVDDPDDRGGETNFGITRATARANGYAGDMRAMTRQQASDIYRSQYWKRPGLDQVALYSVPIAEEMFDTGVNCGPSTAGKFLQRALNVLSDPPELVVDGAIGPATLQKLKAFLNRRGKDGEKVLLRLLDGQQAVYYMSITEGRAANRRFMYGWALSRLG